METGLISIYVGGVLTLFLAIFHTRFYKLFQWEKEYQHNTLLNRRVFYTIHVALFLLFFLFAFISLVYARELSKSEGLALGVNISFSAFWLWRALWQIYYFRPSKDKRPAPIWYVMLLSFFSLFIAYLIPVLLKMLQ
ncbi:MAG: hypothetical protein C0399_07635 [Syntrophus sp. (in: bacteria)]|nr:hypothetical protein [Syntrophus sp. (in: bacteria)]